MGYSRALPRDFPYMSVGFALSWHDYYRIDQRLDPKASYDFTVEKLIDDYDINEDMLFTIGSHINSIALQSV